MVHRQQQDVPIRRQRQQPDSKQRTDRQVKRTVDLFFRQPHRILPLLTNGLATEIRYDQFDIPRRSDDLHGLIAAGPERRPQGFVPHRQKPDRFSKRFDVQQPGQLGRVPYVVRRVARIKFVQDPQTFLKR